ncbi:hypothetical protein CASFOL_019209 [Castilleja foliolosa]|uniref:Cytochrome b5 heme-binding domain-containing protein n=1 Tax=Castilleja foliolosa TaxID=1961234 RepID=A0ABD3D7J9_9LAMI
MEVARECRWSIFFFFFSVGLTLYYVVSNLFGSSDDGHIQQRSRAFEEKTEPLLPPVQLGEVTADELKQYDGSDPKKPLLMAIKGQIYDVTQSSASDEKSLGGKDATDYMVLATDLIRVIESSILSFRQFIKTDKKKQGGVRNIFTTPNQMATPGQQIQSSLEKKATKLKDVWKRNKSYKKKTWPSTSDDVEMLLGLIDVKVLLRILRMVRISKEQLFWCEEKIKKLGFSEGKLQRDPTPIVFPC